MLKSRRIDHEPQALRDFATSYQEASGFPAPLDYLSRCRVRGFFDADAKLVGGYALNSVAPFRYAETTPAGSELARADPSDLQELTLMWKSRRVEPIWTVQIYASAAADIFRGDRRHVLFGTTAPSLAPLFGSGATRLLYHGPTLLGPSGPPAWIFLGTRWSFARGVWVTFRTRVGRTLGVDPRSAARAPSVRS